MIRRSLLTRAFHPDEKEAGVRAAFPYPYALSHDGKRVALAAVLHDPSDAEASPHLGGPGRPRRAGERPMAWCWTRVLDVESGKVLLYDRAGQIVRRTATRPCFSRDGRRLITGAATTIRTMPRRRPVKIVNCTVLTARLASAGHFARSLPR